MNKPPAATFNASLLIGLGIAWMYLVVLAIGAQFAIPAFESVLASFGSDLPGLTRFTMAYHRTALFLPVATGLVLAFWPGKPRNAVAALVFCCLSIMSVKVMLLSLYLPIFQLGEIV